MDDSQLLNEYATRNSQEAFRTLVDRHTAMVYHAALRQVGDRTLAEEITQAVFIALAQKAAKLRNGTVLCGWLFRATRFAVLNAVRQEGGRRRREQEAHALETIMNTNDAESVWEEISAHLDDALDRLSNADRELVVTRFFGNKSHKEMARALGISEDTAKKRLSRALEKLRAIFTRRGVVVPSVALIAALSACGAQAAPVGLAASTTTAALTKGVATPSTLAITKETLRLMSWVKGKIAVTVGVGLLLAAGTTGVVLNGSNRPENGVIGKLEEQSGKIIVCDRRVALPTSVDIKDLPLEQALDNLAVQASAYWTIDYAVYGSDQSLQQLLDLLRAGTDLASGGWTNLSSRPLRAAVSVQMSDPHGRSRSFLRLRDNPSDDSVAMSVVLGPDASARWMDQMAAQMRNGQSVNGNNPPPPGSPFQVVSQAMKVGQADGVLAPERLLAETRLVSGVALTIPQPARAKAAAWLAWAVHAHWTTIYTLRPSPFPGAGIKLVHAGMETSYWPTNLTLGNGGFMQNMQSNRYGLSPEDRAAHDRAVSAFKQQR